MREYFLPPHSSMTREEVKKKGSLPAPKMAAGALSDGAGALSDCACAGVSVQ